MAENIIQTLLLRGTDQAVRQLDQVGAAGEKAFDKLDEGAAKATNAAKGLDKVTRSSEELKDIDKVANNFGKSIGQSAVAVVGLAKNLALLGTVAAGAGAAAGGALFAIARNAANATDALRDAAIAAGTTVQSFARLQFAADQSGASAGALGRAFAIINAGGEDLEKSLGKFNVRLKNANGTARDSAEVFKEFADKIADIEDPAERSAAAAEVFGRRVGPGLVELLSQGAAGLAKFSAEADRLGITMSDAEVKVGDDFNDALQRTTATISALATRVGLALGPGFIRLFDSITEAVVRLRPQIEALAQTFGTSFDNAIKSLITTFGDFGPLIAATILGLGGLGVALSAIVVILRPFAGLISAAFNPFVIVLRTLTASVGLLNGALGVLIGGIRLFGIAATAAFGPWGILIAAAIAAITALAIVLATRIDWVAFGQAAMAAWQTITSAATSAATTITEAWNAVVTFFQTVWEGITAGAAGVWNAIVEGVNIATQAIFTAWETVVSTAQEAWDSVVSTINSAIDQIMSFIQPLVDQLRSLFQWATRVAQALGGLQGEGGGVGGFAGGGMVRGPGTATSDSILARLSDGEFVIRAKAVQHYGPALLHAINSLRLPLSRLRGFNMGGLVDTLASSLSPIPHFADGGLVGAGAGGRPINLTLPGGDTFSMTADGETADKLIKYVVRQQTRSAGRKPNWVGGGR